MLSLLTSLFTPPPPRCHNTGSLLLASRRAATDAKYTARPLDFFPNHLVPRQMLEETRREAGVLDEMFGRYKREAKCGGATGRLSNCERCGDWCCNVSLAFSSWVWIAFVLGRLVLSFVFEALGCWSLGPFCMLADVRTFCSSTGLQIPRELPHHMFVASNLFGRIPPPARNH